MGATVNDKKDELTVQQVSQSLALASANGDRLSISTPSQTVKVTKGGGTLELKSSDKQQTVTLDKHEVSVESLSRQQIVTVVSGIQTANSAGTGNTVTFTGVAAQALSGERVVIQEWDTGKINYADNANTDHLNKVLGITQHAANQDAQVIVQTMGPMRRDTFAFTEGLPVFLGSNGHITQTKPTRGFIVQIGIATQPDTLYVDLKTVITLS